MFSAAERPCLLSPPHTLPKEPPERKRSDGSWNFQVYHRRSEDGDIRGLRQA
jgi:hypothetical protein